MGGLDGHLDETRQVRRKGSDVPHLPTLSEDVAAAEPDDEDRAGHSDDFIDGLHRIFPEIG